MVTFLVKGERRIPPFQALKIYAPISLRA